MGKARIVLAVALLAGHAMASEASRAAGCVRSSTSCTCFDAGGKPVQVQKQLCEAAFAPSLLTVQGGDISTLATKHKGNPVQEYEPLQKRPIPWLIER